MRETARIKFIMPALLLMICTSVLSQTVPAGIFYQAVARDNYGKELSNREIDVRFTIFSGSPEGEIAYQEVHQNEKTSLYGVFNLIIGYGIYTAGTSTKLGDIAWETANHYVKVEVKFDNDYIDMGTMQFLAVPYALYAKRSLEPGPQGPKGDTGQQGQQGVQGQKGDPGDPASDNQTLSFDGINLSLTVGDGNPPSVVNLSTLNIPHSLSIVGDTLSILGGNKVMLPNYTQDLQLDVNNILKITKNSSASSIDLNKYLDNTDRQNLSFNSGNNILSVTGGTSADLTPMKQNLSLAGNTLTITNIASPTPIDLSKYLQSLSYNSSTNRLSISNVAGDIDLSGLKNDADADPANEIQSLTFDKNSGNLSISSSNSVSINNIIGFKAKKTVSQSGLTIGTTYDFIVPEVEFNEGEFYNSGSGSFVAPITGIYTFFVTYKADGPGSGRVLNFLKNGIIWEVLGPDISSGAELYKWVTVKLNQGESVRLTINTGMSTYSGTGSFVGYRVN